MCRGNPAGAAGPGLAGPSRAQPPSRRPSPPDKPRGGGEGKARGLPWKQPQASLQTHTHPSFGFISGWLRVFGFEWRICPGTGATGGRNGKALPSG